MRGRLYRYVLLGLAIVALAGLVLLGANLRTEIAYRRIKIGSTRAKVRAGMWGFRESHVSVVDIPREWRHGIPSDDSSRVFRYDCLGNDVYVVYDKHWRATYKIPAYE